MSSPAPDLARLRIDRHQVPAPQRRALGWAVGLALVAVLFVGGGYLILRSAPGLDVQVGRAEVLGGGTDGGGITANGYIVARTRASVSSRISGRLARLEVEEGSVVRRGQVMAELENADFLAAVAQAEAESLRAEASLREAMATRDQLARDLERARELADRNLGPVRTAEDLAAQVTSAEARVAALTAQIQVAAAGIQYARANLENTRIRAPFDGTVLRKDAELGEVVAPVAMAGGLTRGAVVTMADLETLEVEVDVNEAYIARIRGGQPARVTLDAYPADRFRGTVRQIVPTADRQRATVEVKVSLLDRDPRILPEMGAQVEFLAEAADSTTTEPARIMVPAAAVRNLGDSTIVWVVRDGIAVRTTVTAGPVSGGRREVRAGLSGGEMLILDPPPTLTDGARFHVPAS